MNDYKCLKTLSRRKSLKSRAALFSSVLEKLYPDAECSLDYERDPFRLLVMSRLSAQCTDKRVNEVSKTLFKILPDVYAFANADIKQIEELIKSCGLYRMKARNLKDMALMLIDDYNEEVPQSRDELLKLPGVGIKIANLIMGDLFHDPYIVPDTHCIRISHRTGLVSKPDANACIKELSEIIPKKEQSDFCHRIVLFGRDICKAQNPDCDRCPLASGEKTKD